MHHFTLRLICLLLLTAWSIHAQVPVSAEEFSQRGINRFEKNDLEGAIADFTRVIELNGQQLEFCFYFRGIALYRRGRLDEAIADLSKAITLKQHPRFYGDRANLSAHLTRTNSDPRAGVDPARRCECGQPATARHRTRGHAHHAPAHLPTRASAAGVFR